MGWNLGISIDSRVLMVGVIEVEEEEGREGDGLDIIIVVVGHGLNLIIVYERC